MNKASKILLLIGGILGILVAVFTLLAALFAFGLMQVGGIGYTGIGIFSLLLDMEVIDLGFRIFNAMETDIVYIVEGVLMYALSFVVLVVCFLSFLMHLIASIIALKSRGKNVKKGLYIANFVFAGLLIFIFGTDTVGFIAEALIIVGSILGLIALKKEQQGEPELGPEEAPAVEEVK